MIWLILLSVVIFVIVLVNALKLRYVVKLFDQGNVIVTGLRGKGKDMLFGNVIARRKKPYVSNVDYKLKRSPYIPLQMSKVDVLNDFNNFMKNDIVPYDYPYPEKCDVYVSDAGVYMPSQEQGKLCKEYGGIVSFQALSRHVGDCNFHCNVQNLNRLWDKVREQSDIYIRCIDCKVIRNRVFQTLIIYDKYESCLNRVEPYVHIKAPLSINGQVKAEYRSKDELAFREFKERNGSVKRIRITYRNKSKYDTRLFKSLLKGDKCG